MQHSQLYCATIKSNNTFDLRCSTHIETKDTDIQWATVTRYKATLVCWFLFPQGKEVLGKVCMREFALFQVTLHQYNKFCSYQNGVTMQIEKKCDYVHFNVFNEKHIENLYFHTGSGLSLFLDLSQKLVDMVFTQGQQIHSMTALLLC